MRCLQCSLRLEEAKLCVGNIVLSAKLRALMEVSESINTDEAYDSCSVVTPLLSEVLQRKIGCSSMPEAVPVLQPTCCFCAGRNMDTCPCG